MRSLKNQHIPNWYALRAESTLEIKLDQQLAVDSASAHTDVAMSPPQEAVLPNPYLPTPGADWALFSREYARKHRGRTMHRGFINSGFLNGFVQRVDKRVIWVQQSSNLDHSLPVLLPQSFVHSGRAPAVHMPISIQYTAQGVPARSRELGYIVASSLRYIGACESAALPLSAAFLKRPRPGEAGNFDSSFNPMGSGLKLSGTPNQMFLAGIIAGKRTIMRQRIEDSVAIEYAEYSEILLRQDEEDHNRIPVRLYRSNHKNLVSSVRVGDPVYVVAELKIQWHPSYEADGALMTNPDGSLRRHYTTYFQTDAFRVASQEQILYLPHEEKLPTWAQELRGRATLRRRVQSEGDRQVSPGSISDAAAEEETVDHPVVEGVPIATWLVLPVNEQYDQVGTVVNERGSRLAPAAAAGLLSESARADFSAEHRRRQTANAH